MDYAILMQQHSRDEPKVLLANACSALTTICSFGFLAISQSPVLSAFGSTILIGVIISFMTSSLIYSTPDPSKVAST
jgi:predicted exporter